MARKGLKRRLREQSNEGEIERLRARLRAAEEAAEEQRRAAEEQRRAAEEQRTLQQELNEGTYYTTYNDLWNVQYMPFQKGALESLTRRNPNFTGMIRRNIAYYVRTVEYAENDEYQAADAKTEERSGSTNHDRQTWPQHVLEARKVDNHSEEAGGSSTTTNPQGHLAHLVPASSEHAGLHIYVAPLVFGMPDASLEVTKKLIHGSKIETGNREPLVGVKHFATNKIRLCGQADYFDRKPNVLIVPILGVEETKEWNGGGYDALFLIGVDENVANTRDGRDELRHAAQGTLLNISVGPTASQDEIETARSLLETSILALSYSVKQMMRNDQIFNGLTDYQRTHLSSLQAFDQAPCPRAKRNAQPRVRKISFCDALSTRGRVGHPAPDPTLLVMKAANNWSKAHGLKLLAGGEESEEDMMSERSLLALEMHMNLVNEMQKKQMNEEICGMEISC